MEFKHNGKYGELLSPAGDPDKLKSAILYGADAVYLAGKKFGMRTASANFDKDELEWAVGYCHTNGVRAYITLNVMPRTSEYEEIGEYIKFIDSVGADAVIVGDLGVFSMVRSTAPDLAVHVSTQTSSVSAQSCCAWHTLGASRIVLARELSLDEIREIRKNIPPELELESFIHGSMCISFSGRCLLSNYFTGRDANHGACAQPCRWQYNVLDLGEEKREGSVLSLEEDDRGNTFIMSSKDLSMIEHIEDLESSGLNSYKIEGRVKSAYYVAVVTNTYRIALDTYRNNPGSYRTDSVWVNELDSVSHREYDTGFFYNCPGEDAKTVTMPGYIREKTYLATAVSCSEEKDENGMYEVVFVQKNKLSSGDDAEIISPGKTGRRISVSEIFDEKGKKIDSAPHSKMIFRVKIPFLVHKGDIMRSVK